MLNLTNDSKLLINYYAKLINMTDREHIFSQNKNKFPKFSKFLSEIFKTLDNIYDLLITDFNNIGEFRQIYSVNSREINSLIDKIYTEHFLSNKYIDNSIKDYIKNEKSWLLSYNLPYKSSKITINFFIYSNFSQKSVIKYDNFVIHMLALIYLIGETSLKNNCSKNGINIQLFLTPFKREIRGEKILGAKNVNGGFCYGCIERGDIVVYRKEELFKVFSHELIHNFGIDENVRLFSEAVNNKSFNEYKLYKKFLSNFNLSREINSGNFDLSIQESLTEFWGSFFNNIIYSYNYVNFLSKSDSKLEKFKNIFEKINNLELIHAFLQSTKILNYNKLNYNSIISKNKNYFSENIFNYREKSHIFSYYIFKLMLLFNYKSFINSSISLNFQYKIYFNNSLKNFERFFNYITNIALSKSFISHFNFTQELYQFLISNSKKKGIKYLTNNLKMTTLEYFI